MVFALFLVFSGGFGTGSQEVDWRSAFAAGEEARGAGDAAGYARHMAEAVRALPEGHLNRPFAQYHAARAHALVGDAAAAVDYLAMAWDEGIEGLMISMADVDPAFATLRDDPGYREVMARADTMALEVRRLGGSVHLVHRAGSQVLASVGADGVLLVDTGYGAALPALRRALGGLGASGVDALVVTHPHEDHWGGAEGLAGEATVYAHPATLAAMGEPYEFMDEVVIPPRSRALRDAVVPMEEGSLDFNGEEVRVLPFPSHTAGDVAVLFPASGVVHLGDVYLAGNPMIYPGEEDPEGFLTRMEELLESLPPGTTVVGGHDEPASVDAIRDQVTRTRACMALVRGAVDEGLDPEATVARAEGRFPAAWVRFFHRLLSGGSA